ncbi:tetratricopeptide repeat protein [Actinomadura sp. 6N118]|uniref:tetratricopeptide repeat protein n=1 Tax=Actinomadura sp. 6N118 TaxID=3375151 RepID=UPI0037B81EB7
MSGAGDDEGSRGLAYAVATLLLGIALALVGNLATSTVQVKASWWVPTVWTATALLVVAAVALLGVKTRTGRAQLLRAHALNASRRGRLPKVRTLPQGPDARGRERGSRAAYIGRDADDDIDTALSLRRAVLLQGPSASGKTRTAWQAVCRLAAGQPGLRVLVPVAPDSLSKLAEADVRLRDTVIWLDDLETYLGPGQLDRWTLTRLAEGNGVFIVATVRTRALAGVSAPDGTLNRSAAEVLGILRPPVRLVRELTSTELERAEAHRDDAMIDAALQSGSVVRLAEYLAGGGVALDRWRRGQDGDQPEGAALVSAAVYARALGHGGTFTQTALERLAAHFLDAPLANTQEALEWATIVEDDIVACLRRTADGLFQPFDYLVDHVQDEPFDLPESFWRTAHDLVSPEDVLQFAATALQFGHADLAVGALRRGVAERPGDNALLFALGTLLWDHGDSEEAEPFLQAAAGLPAAANNLAALFLERGQHAVAVDLFARAAEAGSAEAGNNLGCLRFDEAANAADAERAFRTMANTPEAMSNLAVLLTTTGRFEEAEGWFLNALSSHVVAARNNYGLHLAEIGLFERAEVELRQAVDIGMAAAQNNLRQVLDRLHGVDDAAGEVSFILLGVRTAADGSAVSFPIPYQRASRIQVPELSMGNGADPWSGSPGLYSRIAAASPYPARRRRSPLFDRFPLGLLSELADYRSRWTGDTHVLRLRRQWVGLPGDQVVHHRDSDEFSFLVLGSTGGAGGPSQYAVVPGLLKVGADTDFMIICGDALQPASDAGSAGPGFFAPYRAYQAPIYAVPGAQDWRDGLVEFMGVFCDRSLQSSGDDPALADARRLRSAAAQQALQPGPYWMIDSPDLRIVGIDTGIDGTIDRDQADWLRQVSTGPKAKLLITANPIYADNRHRPGYIEDGGGTIDDIVRDSNYIAVIGGGVHNYQRYPVHVVDDDAGSRTVQYLVAGGSGAFIHATHTIGRTKYVPEETFDCYPLRSDSLLFYSRMYGSRLRRFGLRRFFDLDRREAAAVISQRLRTTVRSHPDHEGVRPGLRARYIAALMGVPRAHRRSLGWKRLPVRKISERYFVETTQNALPPFFKSFLRIDVTADTLRARCYGVTGLREHEINPPIVTEFVIPLR